MLKAKTLQSCNSDYVGPDIIVPWHTFANTKIGGRLMERISNPYVATLSETLLGQMREQGYCAYCIKLTIRFAKHLNSFMEQNQLQTYDESVGSRFVNAFCQQHVGTSQQRIKGFIARMNAMLNGTGFVYKRSLYIPEVLPIKLEELLTGYKNYCAEQGNGSTSILQKEHYCRRFLKALADEGVDQIGGIKSASISKAWLQMTGNYEDSAIRTFLRFLADAGYLDRDYSFLILSPKQPQPMPSVYSIDDIQKIEAEMRRDSSTGKRDYAELLLATRLGIRVGDIAEITFDELDFQSNTIRIIQQKTNVPLELPMLPVIREALLDYIQNFRGDSKSPYVFLSLNRPYSHVSAAQISSCVRLAIKAAGIDAGHRKRGAHAMRSSLASSMVNDGISYEVVRKTLGHTDKNAIRHYAKLDIEQLKLYTLEPPAATGRFAEILFGGCPAK